MSGRFDRSKPKPELADWLRAIMLLMLVVFMVLVWITPINAARSNSDDIGIVLSKNCEIMVENNFLTNCPDYRMISLLFPDTTNPALSGGFEYVDGIYQRVDPSHLKGDHLARYFNEKPMIWIDPPSSIRDRIKLITIHNTLPDYKIPGISNKMVNNTITMGHDRYVDSKCFTSAIAAKEFVFLLGDTIHYLNNDCNPEFTNFEHLRNYTFAKSFQDKTTSYKYQLEAWIEESKIKCLGICKEY